MVAECLLSAYSIKLKIEVMATMEQRAKDIQSSWEREREGVVFVKDGLFGMRDIDGTVIHRAEFAFIGKSRDDILFIRQDGTYCKKSPGCIENGYMSEELMPLADFIVNLRNAFSPNLDRCIYGAH